MKRPLQRCFVFCFILICESGFTQPAAAYDHISWDRISISEDYLDTFSAEAAKEGALIALNDGKLIIAGGKKKADGKISFDDAIALLEFRNGGFRNMSISSFRLEQKMAYAGVFSGDDGVYCIGGENDGGLLKTAFILQWNPVDKQFVQVRLPDIPVALRSPAITVLGQKIYITGGESATGRNRVLYALDRAIAPLTWTTYASLPDTVEEVKLFVQSDGSGPSVFAFGRDAVHGACRLFIYTRGQWIFYSSFPDISSQAVPVGSTFALGMDRHSRDSLVLYNTITRRSVNLDAASSPGMKNRTILKLHDALWLIGLDADGRLNIWKGTFNTHTFFSVWDLIVIIVYLALSLVIGLYMAGKQKSTANYFKGGGKVPGWAVGISILGTNLSAITFMSVPAKTYATNWGYFFLMISVVLVIPVINRYFIPFYRKLNITSAYEYLDKRFNYSVRLIASLLYMLLEIGRMSIILILPSIALSVVIGIDVAWCILLMGLITVFYTFKGGIRAVIWTDVFQVILLMGGALVCLMYIPFQLPVSGEEMFRTVTANHKFDIIDIRFSLDTPNFFVVLVGGFILNFLSFGTDQTTVQRYLTTKDEKTTRRSVRIGAWLTLPVGIIFFSIGTLLYLFYYYYPEKVNISLESQDSIFPWYLASQLPTGVLGLLIAAVFAAAMSALGSSLNSMSTAFVTDVYRVFITGRSDRSYLLAAKVTTLFIGLFATGFALYMARRGVVSLWDQFNTIVGLFTGGIGGIFLLGLFTTRANVQGALAGLLIGGLCQYLISQYTSVNFLLYAFTGLAICFLSGLLISYCFPPPSKDISGLTVSGP